MSYGVGAGSLGSQAGLKEKTSFVAKFGGNGTKSVQGAYPSIGVCIKSIKLDCQRIVIQLFDFSLSLSVHTSLFHYSNLCLGVSVEEIKNLGVFYRTYLLFS